MQRLTATKCRTIDLLQGFGQVYLLNTSSVERRLSYCLQTRRYLYLGNAPLIIELISWQRGIQHTVQVHFYQIGHAFQVTPVVGIEFTTYMDFVDFLQITGFVQCEQSQFAGSSHVYRDFHRCFRYNQHLTPPAVDAIGMEGAIGNGQLPMLRRIITV